MAEVINDAIGIPKAFTQQSLSRYMSEITAIDDHQIREIIQAFPKYRYEWLAGIDEWKTKSDRSNHVQHAEYMKNNKMDQGISLLAESAGYEIKTSWKETNTRELESGTIQSEMIPHFYILYDGKRNEITREELSQIGNEVADFVGYLLSKKMHD